MKFTHIRWLIVFVVVGVFAGCGVTENTDTYKGSTVPWSELLATAQAEAQKVDPQAVLVYVSAVEPNPTLLTDGSPKILNLAFTYRRMSGDIFNITLLDTTPSTTARLFPQSAEITKNSSYKTMSQETIQHLQQKDSTTFLSPTQAIQATVSEGKTYGKEQKRTLTTPTVSLLLNPETLPNAISSAGIWRVYYHSSQESLVLWVDATTGVIVKREVEHFAD